MQVSSVEEISWGDVHILLAGGLFVVGGCWVAAEAGIERGGGFGVGFALVRGKGSAARAEDEMGDGEEVYEEDFVPDELEDETGDDVF